MGDILLLAVMGQFFGMTKYRVIILMGDRCLVL